MKTDLVKGFRDFTGQDAQERKKVKEIITGVFEEYGFEAAETPVIEYEEFVKGKANKTKNQDEAISDVYTLKDKGKRKLALRYEFTFQLKRLVKDKKLPYKRYEIGEVFRDEPASGGKARFRQFTQCDVDIVGSSGEDCRKNEAEVLSVANRVFNELNIPITIYVGNRNLLNEIINDELTTKPKTEVERKAWRDAILREIDKLDKLSVSEVKKNLKQLGAEKLVTILTNKQNFFKKYKAYKEVEELERYCGFYKLKTRFKPSLVRGLSYYNGNVFEIKAETKDMNETICAGGSYPVNDLQATGISFGLERVTAAASLTTENNQKMIVSLNQDKEAIGLAEKLRNDGQNIIIYYGKPSKALEFANSKKITEVIFVGEKEVKSGKYKVKDMGTGKEKVL